MRGTVRHRGRWQRRRNLHGLEEAQRTLRRRVALIAERLHAARGVERLAALFVDVESHALERRAGERTAPALGVDVHLGFAGDGGGVSLSEGAGDGRRVAAERELPARMFFTERSFANTSTTSMASAPNCRPMLPPVRVMKAGLLQPPFAERTSSTPRPRRPPTKKPPRMTFGITAMPRARCNRSIGIPFSSSAVKFWRTADACVSLASSRRFGGVREGERRHDGDDGRYLNRFLELHRLSG